MITQAQTDEMRELMTRLGRAEWHATGSLVFGEPKPAWGSVSTPPIAALGHPHQASAEDFARYIVLSREMLRALLGVP